jgi:membrane protease YdiL (CAAX protease family)
MLFLLKRTVFGSLAALAVLALLGLGLRAVSPGPLPALAFTPEAALAGLVVVAGGLVGDGLIHGVLWLLFRERYLARYRELAGVFRGQTWPALLCGALLAGVGEELFFRGASTSPVVLATAGVLFGLCHHLPGRRAVFTPWSIWEGLLFGAAVWWTQLLTATMLAHFLHDVIGFVLFRRENTRTKTDGPGA